MVVREGQMQYHYLTLYRPVIIILLLFKAQKICSLEVTYLWVVQLAIGIQFHICQQDK